MASKGSQTVEELSSEIEELKKQLAAAQAQNAKKDEAIRAGSRGWLITTPRPEYSGKTAGLQFDGGMAFIPADMKGGAALARRMQYDFGYTVTETENGEPVPEKPDTSARNAMDALVIPQMRGMVGG